MLKSFVLVLGLLVFISAVEVSPAGPVLGDAPRAPTDVTRFPSAGPHPQFVTGGLDIDTTSREQVREFYNAIYNASAGIPLGSSAVTANCLPGTNSSLYSDATLLRINWFRAFAGVSARETFDVAEDGDDQSAALMMSAQGELQHTGNWTGWDCYTADGTNAAANSNLALGFNGPDAITAYIWDFGVNNYATGHRRQLIFPQTQIMAAGDVPAEGTNESGNATWVFDANYFNPRPATRNPFVSWPPPGYVPFQVVFPRWSFALSNADLSAATVTMSSNGVVVPVTVQPYDPGYGENTVVWYPTSIDPTSSTTGFPFSGTDASYSVTIGNVVTASGTNSFTYNVTVINPVPTGPGYVAEVVAGTNQPSISVGNSYTCTPGSNPHTTGYQWLAALAPSGNVVDNALNGLTNFTLSPAPPPYPIITNAPVGTATCFHLIHYDPANANNPVPQLLQLKEVLFPATNTTISFKSLLGYASTNEAARFEISTNNGGTWLSLFSQLGSEGAGQTAFTPCTLSLSNYAGESVLARFNFDFTGAPSYYAYNYPYVGWCVENIIVTNSLQLVNPVTNTTTSTNFTFIPTLTNNYVLEAQAVIFNQFPLDWGPPKEVTAIIGPPVIKLANPSISGNQVKIKFTLSSGLASTFHLLQASQLPGVWTTNATAVFTTNVAGSSWQFTTTNGSGPRFYRVQTP